MGRRSGDGAQESSLISCPRFSVRPPGKKCSAEVNVLSGGTVGPDDIYAAWQRATPAPFKKMVEEKIAELKTC